MASFDADINLSVQVEKALSGIRKVESAIAKVQKIGSTIGDIGKTDVRQTVRSLNVIKGSLTGVAKTVKFVSTNFTQLGITLAAVETLNFANNFKGLRGPLTEAASALASFTDRAVELAASQPLLTAQIAAGTVALAAFAPQIAAVTTRIVKFAVAAAAAKAPLQSLLNEYSKVTGAFDGSFAEFDQQFKTEIIEAYRRRLFEISETVSELTSRQSRLKQNLDRFNSSSDTAQKIAGKLVDVRKRLNDELRAQNTLLAQATRNQRAFNEQAQVGTNLARSRASRKDSGFANFSQAASRVNKDQRAVDKAISRRQRKVEKFAKGLDASYGQAPLMLPSSEMLNASGKGIQRLSTYYGDLNGQIDQGLKNSREFSEQLNAQADKAQTLPPIFKDVERALKRTNTVVNRAAQTSRGVATPAAGPVQSRTQGLRKLASLQQRLIAETAELEQRRITETANLRETKALKSYNTRRRRIKFLAEEQQKQDRKTAAARTKRLQGRNSALSNVAIGASFPLLFGQSGAAAIGGAVGGGLGSLLGPTGGFAGSLIGTVIGDLIDAQTEIKNLARDIGLGKEATDELTAAFTQAGQGAEDFAAAVQGVRGIGLSVEEQGEAIRLSSQLAEEYGGKIEKITETFNKVATAGKASFSDLARIAGQGVPIFEQLQESLGVNRDELLLLAKDGKVSAQTTVDALVDIGNAAEGNAARTEGRWQKAWRLVKEAATISLKAVGILLGVLYGDVNATTGDIAVSFAQLYRDLVVGAANAAARIAEAFAGVAAGIAGYADVFKLGGLNPIATGISDAAREASERLTTASTALKGLTDASKEAFKPIKKIQLPGELENETTGGGGRGGRSAAGTERESQVPALQRELDLIRKVYDIQLKIDKAKADNDQDLAARLSGEERLAVIEKARLDIIAEQIPNDEKELKLLINKVEVLDAQRQTEEELNRLQRERQNQINQAVIGFTNEVELLNQRNEYARDLLRIEQDIIALKAQDPNITERQVQQYRAAAQGAAVAREEQRKYNQTLAQVTPGVNALVGGLRAVATGTKSVEETFADFLNTIADQLAQTAAQMIAQFIAIGIARKFAFGGNPAGSFLGPGGNGLGQLFGDYTGFAGAFANGGRIPSGQFGLVGENGPEFINGPARITPMGEGGSTVVNITVNSNGGGSSSASGNNAQDAARLGRLIERSTLAIITREKRAGGTLSR